MSARLETLRTRVVPRLLPWLLPMGLVALWELSARAGWLSTRVLGRDGASPVYAMLLDLRVPDAVPDATLEADLADLSGSLGVDCTLRPIDADIF